MACFFCHEAPIIMRSGWITLVNKARWAKKFAHLLIAMYTLFLTIFTFVLPPAGGVPSPEGFWANRIISWCLAHKTIFVSAGILIVTILPVIWVAERIGLWRLSLTGERCPSINSLVVSLRDHLIHVAFTSEAKYDRFWANRHRFHVILYKANKRLSKLVAVAASQGFPNRIRSFRINLHQEEANKGIPAKCWFDNKGKPPHDKPDMTSPARRLPSLADRCDSVELADEITKYSELTFDDPKKVQQLRPKALSQIALPILLQGHSHKGELVPWGVLFVYSELCLTQSDQTFFREAICTPGGFMKTLQDILSKQLQGQDSHCIGL